MLGWGASMPASDERAEGDSASRYLGRRVTSDCVACPHVWG